MSAAEKLRARDGRGFPLITDAQLRKLLPELIAVVEAADEAARTLHQDAHVGAVFRLSSALGDLDVKLGL